MTIASQGYHAATMPAGYLQNLRIEATADLVDTRITGPCINGTSDPSRAGLYSGLIAGAGTTDFVPLRAPAPCLFGLSASRLSGGSALLSSEHIFPSTLFRQLEQLCGSGTGPDPRPACSSAITTSTPTPREVCEVGGRPFGDAENACALLAFQTDLFRLKVMRPLNEVMRVELDHCSFTTLSLTRHLTVIQHQRLLGKR